MGKEVLANPKVMPILKDSEGLQLLSVEKGSPGDANNIFSLYWRCVCMFSCVYFRPRF